MRKSRGLSTVVGAVFFVIAATTVITYITYSMNSIENFSNSIIASQSQNVDRGNEQIKISKVSIDGNKFNMTVVNTGSLPVKLTRLWVTDQDLAIPSDKKANLSTIIDPGKEVTNIGQSTSITASSSTTYNLKVVTERGNIATFQVSPKVSTNIQVIMPATIGPGATFRVAVLITNNSTSPNNIANLVPTLVNNATLTPTDPLTPSSVKTLAQGNTVAFISKYTAPSTPKAIQFKASYVGAPVTAFTNSTIRAEVPVAAEQASNSQWSQAASRVGILISGIANPIETSNTATTARFGIGIINPLDRPVQIFAVSIFTPGAGTQPFNSVTGIEPSDGNWSLTPSKMILWQNGANPVTIPAKSVGQFRVTSGTSNIQAVQELLAVIQVLSSEGKLSSIYSVSTKNSFSTMNMFYTNNTSSPVSPDKNWGYLYKGIKSGRIGQIFNATVENTSNTALASKVKLILLIPADFKNVGTGTVLNAVNTANGWTIPVINNNLDGSTVITTETTTNCLTSCNFPKGTKVFQYKADIPTVTDTKLYVFQTTSVYPQWSIQDATQIVAALSEAGIQVVP